jgi:hypothetical protein
VASATPHKRYALTGVTPDATTPFTVSSGATYTGTYKTQYEITFDASNNVKGDSTATIVTVGGNAKTSADLPFPTFVDDGGSIAYSYASNVASTAAPTTKRYRWDSTSGLSQTLQSNTITVSGAGTVTGDYKAQFQVSFDASNNVKGDSAATIVTVGGNAKTSADLPFPTFVDDGGSIAFSYASNVASTAAPTTKRYRWDSTSGLSQTLQSNTITVSGAGTVTGDYKAQFQVSFDASNNVKGDSTATIVTVGGNAKTSADLPFPTFVDDGGSIAFSYASNVASTAAPTTKRYRWDSTSGLSQTLQSNTITVSGAGTVTGDYKAQFQVSFDASNNVKGDSTATIVTVGGNAKTSADLPFPTFVDDGGSIAFSYASNVASTAAPTTKRYRWDSTSGLSQTLQTNTITVAGAGTVTGDYKVQYQVSFDASNNVKGDSTATIVTVGGNGKTSADLPFGAFVDEGDSIVYSYASPVASTSAAASKRFDWSSTSGLGQSAQSNTFNVTGAGTVTGSYTVAWKVTFDQSGIGSDTGGNTIVTVAGNAQAKTNLPHEVWVADGGSIGYAYESTVATSPASDKQYTLTNAPGTSIASVTSAQTVTGTYGVQWKVTFAQTGIGGDTGTNTVVTVAGNPQAAGALPSFVWVADGGSVSYAFASTVATSPAGGKQYSLTNSPGTSIASVTAAQTVTGTYGVQWKVTFAQSGIGSDTGANTVVTIAGSPKAAGVLPFDVWVNDTDPIGYAYQATVQTSPSSAKRYTLSNTPGTSIASVTAAQTVTGTYDIVYAPAFSNLTGSQSISFGTATVALSGTIAAGSAIPPGNVSVTINGSSQNAAIAPADGSFSLNFATATIPANATPYTISYAFAATTGFDGASDSSTTLTVKQGRHELSAASPRRRPTFGGTTDLSATVMPVGDQRQRGVLRVRQRDGDSSELYAGHRHRNGDRLHARPQRERDRYSVRAVFTSSNTNYDGSEATNATALTVNQATSNTSVGTSAARPRSATR